MYEESVGCSMHQSKWLVKQDQSEINSLEVGIESGQYLQIPGRCAVEVQR